VRDGEIKFVVAVIVLVVFPLLICLYMWSGKTS
jgi:hypothetical protein